MFRCFRENKGQAPPVNTLDTAKTGEEQASSKPPPKTEGSRGKDAVRVHITHKSVPSRRNAVSIVA